jgi:hypothetical protein
MAGGCIHRGQWVLPPPWQIRKPFSGRLLWPLIALQTLTQLLSGRRPLVPLGQAPLLGRELLMDKDNG